MDGASLNHSWLKVISNCCLLLRVIAMVFILETI